MKKSRLLTVIFFMLAVSLACQQVSKLVKGDRADSSEPSVTMPPLPTDTAYTETPAASSPPAQGWIAFINKNNIWLIRPDGSGLRQVTSNADPAGNSIFEMKWSPNGQRLAFSNDRGINLLDIATFKVTPLVEEIDFDWAKDSKQIIYGASIVGEPPSWHDNGFWVINIETSQKRQVVQPSDAWPRVNPQWSPDGNYLIYSSAQYFEPHAYFGVIDLNTGKSNDLPVGGSVGYCNWSPVELQIGCVREVKDQQEMSYEFILTDQNGNVQQNIPLNGLITTRELEPWNRIFAPNGKMAAIGYSSYNTGQDQTILLLSLASGEVRDFVSGVPLGWSPDGRWILTTTLPPVRIITTPDSPQITMTPDPPQQISIANVKTGDSYLLAEGSEIAVWQPSGEWSGALPESQPNAGLTAVPTTSSANEAPCTHPSIKVNDTKKGDYLQICAEGDTYEVGPLAKGAYAIGPNQKFFVYCTNSGSVYAARFGDRDLKLIGKVKNFSIIKRGETPKYDFVFLGDNPYSVQIFELILNQNQTLKIPRNITSSD